MRIIDRYILQEFYRFFALAWFVATFVLILDKLLGLMGLVLTYHLQWFVALRFLSYTLPTISGFTLPMALLIGCTMAFNRLAADSEYVALKAAGVSVYRLLLPLLAVASVIYVLSSFILMYVSPWGFQSLRRLIFDIARTRAQYHLQAREFDDTFRNLVVHVEQTQPDVRRVRGVFIADARAPFPQVITAREGELLAYAESMQVVLRLTRGHVHRYQPTHKRYQWLRFDRYDVRLDLDTRLAHQVSGAIRPRELFPSQLQAEIRQRRAAGEDVRAWRYYWHQLFALPCACFIFAGLGPSLGVVHTRSGRAVGYVFGIATIFAYYLVLTAGNALSKETGWPPVVAAWLPNLLMAGITLWLLRRTA